MRPLRFLPLLAALGTAAAAAPPAVAQAPFRRADANADGLIDISDGIRTLRFLFAGGEVSCLDAADADDSGDLNITDAIDTFLYLFLAGPAPPPPGGIECGADPTADALTCAEYLPLDPERRCGALPASGSITGTVTSPNGRDADVVPGARISIAGGATAVADGFGRFTLDAVPAGEPVALRVEGPDPDQALGEVFGTYECRVTVPTGGTAIVAPRLLRGCRALVDGAGGGTAASDRCAGGGGLAVTFPPEAFATLSGVPVAGTVRVEMTAVDPAVPEDFAALPPDGPGDDGRSVAGGAEVRLFDAASGEPARLAAGRTATLRFEVAARPAGFEDREVRLQSYDPGAGAWVDEGTVALVTESGRLFAEAQVTHFTTYIGVWCCIPEPRTCLFVNLQLCTAPGNCRTICPPASPCPPGRRAQVEILDFDRRSVSTQELIPDGFGRSCIRVRTHGRFILTFTHYENGQLYTKRTPVVNSSSCVPGPGFPPCEPICDPSECTNIFNPADRGGFSTIELEARPFGCVTGTLLTATGQPMTGHIDVLVEGTLVSRFTLPEAGACDTGPGVCERAAAACAAAPPACSSPGGDLCCCDPADAACLTACRGSFCALVPVGFVAPEEVELRDAEQNTVAFVPTPLAPGTTPAPCPSSRPLACGASASGCEDLGTLLAGCDDPIDPLHRRCTRAAFTWEVKEDADSALCGDGFHELRLDGTPSTGDVIEYAWEVTCLMSGCLTWLGSGPEVSLCRPAGAYRVTLRTRIRSYRGWTNRMERVITIDRPPCAAIAFNPIPPSYDCTYDFTGPQPVRDCTGLDGSRLRFTFEDLPCGFPCFTGQPQYFTAGFAFEPLRLPVRQVLIRTSANPTAAFARTEYELDELGNVLSVITYDVNGVPGVKYWYDYDHVGQPGLVSIRRDESGAPGPVQWTEAVSWRHGQVSSYRFGAGGFLSNHTLHYHYGADGQLTGVAWLDAGGNRFATFIITRASDDYKVTWQRLSSTAETTYDFTCP